MVRPERNRARTAAKALRASTLAALGLLSLGSVGEAARKPPPPPPASRIEKLGRILELEDSRTLGAGELERLLRDADRGIRRRAALAAGRIGDPKAVPALVDLMNDQEPEVRQMAAFALGLVRDRSAVDRLVAALGDAEAKVRGRAAEALGRIGDPRAGPEVARFVLRAAPRSATPVVIRGDDPGSPDDAWVELRQGVLALAGLKDQASAETALLQGGRPRFDWWASAWVAMRLQSPQLRPLLLSAAASDDPLARALGARGMGALKDASSAGLLRTLARDQDEGVVVQALRALVALGDEAGTTLAAEALGAQSDVVRREALRALAQLPPDRRHRARLVALVGDRDPWIRSAALPALAHTEREDFALVLSGLDADPVWWVRAELARALGSGGGDDLSVSILHAMLGDGDPRVLPAVLDALRRARGTDARDTLRRHLTHADLGVRAAAAAGLAALGATGSGAELRAAWTLGLGDADPEARLGIIPALVAERDQAAREVLAKIAAEDPSHAVRARAAGALLDLGSAPPDPGREVIRRPALDYRAAMAPYDPLPDVPLFTPRAFLHTRHGVIEIHLDVVEAPLATASFVDLARRGFFDGLTFHRVEPGFVLQGGCPRGDGNGGPGYTLRCEATRRPYGRGSVGMALSGKDTGGSQFFIALSPQPQLDGAYTLFGTVASGMEVVDRIRPGDVIGRILVWTGDE